MNEEVKSLGSAQRSRLWRCVLVTALFLVMTYLALPTFFLQTFLFGTPIPSMPKDTQSFEIVLPNNYVDGQFVPHVLPPTSDPVVLGELRQLFATLEPRPFHFCGYRGLLRFKDSSGALHEVGFTPGHTPGKYELVAVEKKDRYYSILGYAITERSAFESILKKSGVNLSSIRSPSE